MLKRNKLFRHAVARIVLTLVLGSSLIWLGTNLLVWQSPQVASYNQGLELFRDGDAAGAMKAFDQSLTAWRSRDRRSWFEQTFLPAPTDELAAETLGKQAIIFLLLRKPEQARDAFKRSLELNPGNNYPDELKEKEVRRLMEQAMIEKKNLEILFLMNQSMAKQEGKGRPRPGQPSDRPAPGNDPSKGSQPGNGQQDAI